VGTVTARDLAREIDELVDQRLPLGDALQSKLAEWSRLHGWDVSDALSQRLVVRQALLNDIVCQIIHDDGRIFPTPLDLLGAEVPASLVAEAKAAEKDAPPETFNFWADLYTLLIPQAQRRHIGQFWTDEAIAEWMVAWLLSFGAVRMADIGCGAGNFLLKASELSRGTEHPPALVGSDLSPLLLNVTQAAFLSERRKRSCYSPALVHCDYLDGALPRDVDAVVCNPPYTRHHAISPARKDHLQALLQARFQMDVSRQGTLAFYFLLKLVADMPQGSRAAVILPMEVLDARYGQGARQVLCRHTKISAIINFSPQMNAFHKVDVGASILFFSKGRETDNQVRHLTLDSMPSTGGLLSCLTDTRPSRTTTVPFGTLCLHPQDELLRVRKWFVVSAPETIETKWQETGLVVPLRALAKVIRGIATGANDFFVLSAERVKELMLEPFVVRTLQRNRDVQDLVLDENGWRALAESSKGVWLLYLNGERPADESPMPRSLHGYLIKGEKAGYHRRSLVQTRRQWFNMEQREIPPIFFTILTRGNPRFILNQAGVRPLNMFSLIYPKPYLLKAEDVEILWALLNSHFSLSKLHSISRTYGGNTLKVEPRELDNLPVVNPLALPDEIRREVKKVVRDYVMGLQKCDFPERVDEIVERLLSRCGDTKAALPEPLQLVLLEEKAFYETKVKRSNGGVLETGSRQLLRPPARQQGSPQGRGRKRNPQPLPRGQGADCPAGGGPVLHRQPD
jgi:SAM-dependent methyltransferase